MTLAVTLVACKWAEQANYTPSVVAGNFVRTPFDTTGTARKDTLHVVINQESYIIDTIAVGDTIDYLVAVQSFANNLKSFTLAWDTSCVQCALSVDSIAVALESASVPQSGVLYFKSGYNYAAFPVRYITRKSGSPKFDLTVTSDSKFESSSVSFIQPIR